MVGLHCSAKHLEYLERIWSVYRCRKIVGYARRGGGTFRKYLTEKAEIKLILIVIVYFKANMNPFPGSHQAVFVDQRILEKVRKPTEE